MRLLLLLLLVVLLLLRRFFFAACPSLSPVLRCSFCLVRMSRCATRLVRQKLALDSSTPFSCMFVFRVDVLLLTLAGEAYGSGLAVFQGTRATAPS